MTSSHDVELPGLGPGPDVTTAVVVSVVGDGNFSVSFLVHNQCEHIFKFILLMS